MQYDDTSLITYYKDTGDLKIAWPFNYVVIIVYYIYTMNVEIFIMLLLLLSCLKCFVIIFTFHNLSEIVLTY